MTQYCEHLSESEDNNLTAFYWVVSNIVREKSSLFLSQALAESSGIVIIFNKLIVMLC